MKQLLHAVALGTLCAELVPPRHVGMGVQSQAVILWSHFKTFLWRFLPLQWKVLSSPSRREQSLHHVASHNKISTSFDVSSIMPE